MVIAAERDGLFGAGPDGPDGAGGVALFAPELAPPGGRWRELAVADGLAAACKARPVRGLVDFARQEVVVPTGRMRGERFDERVQPHAVLFWREMEAGPWNRYVLVKSTQGGGTFTFVQVPLLWHTCELGESVGFGVPDKNMADDKWREDIRPVIEASRYRTRLPRRGRGAEDGTVGHVVRLGGGAGAIRFMSGGGGSAARAAYTTRVMLITETDVFGRGPGKRLDSVTVEQRLNELRKRVLHFGDDAAIYEECTPSTTGGPIWLAYGSGSMTRVMMRCPHCARYVHPERDHLVGWRDAEDEMEARAGAAYVCPACAVAWDDADRRAAALGEVLVHHTERIVGTDTEEEVEAAEAAASERGVGGRRVRESFDGRGVELAGPMPPTRVFSTRFTAAHNLFWPAAFVAAREWHAARGGGEEGEEEKDVVRNYWALPYDGERMDVTEVSASAICRRTIGVARGVLPPGSSRVGDTPHVVAYGIQNVPSGELPEGVAVRTALRELLEGVLGGAHTGGQAPAVVVVDANWATDDVHAVVRAFNERGKARKRTGPDGRVVGWRGVLAAQGRGAGQDQGRPYQAPKSTSSLRRWIGEACHVERLGRTAAGAGSLLVQFDADHWKGFVHDRMLLPLADREGRVSPGAMTLFEAEAGTSHIAFAKQIDSERREEGIVEGVGWVVRFQRKGSRANHYLDASAMACVGGRLAGMAVVGDEGSLVTVGIDVGKYMAHWVAVVWRCVEGEVLERSPRPRGGWGSGRAGAGAGPAAGTGGRGGRGGPGGVVRGGKRVPRRFMR